jgi:hypothetical protein
MVCEKVGFSRFSRAIVVPGGPSGTGPASGALHPPQPATMAAQSTKNAFIVLRMSFPIAPWPTRQ